MSSEVDLKMNILLINSNGKIREVADADAQISDVARMDRASVGVESPLGTHVC